MADTNSDMSLALTGMKEDQAPGFQKLNRTVLKHQRKDEKD